MTANEAANKALVLKVPTELFGDRDASAPVHPGRFPGLSGRLACEGGSL
jgi:hypothetical protein